MSDQDRDVRIETTTITPAPPELQDDVPPSSSREGVVLPPPGTNAVVLPPPGSEMVLEERQAELVGSVGSIAAPASGSASHQLPPTSKDTVVTPEPTVATSSEGPAPAAYPGSSSAPPASAPAPAGEPAIVPDSGAQPMPVPQLARLSISSDTPFSGGVVESPALLSPLAATRPPFERTETTSTNESRKHTALPAEETPISGPSHPYSYPLRKGTGDSGRTMRSRHWARDDYSPRSPDEGLGKESMLIQCEDEEDDDVAHGTMRMGTSALVSALTALPWESDEDTSADEDYTMTRTQVIYPQRPRPTRMHSSLHTIRPMEMTPEFERPRHGHHGHEDHHEHHGHHKHDEEHEHHKHDEHHKADDEAEEDSDHEHRRRHFFHRRRSRPTSREDNRRSIDSTDSKKSRSTFRSKSRSASPHKHHRHFRHGLDFPYRENVVARRAQAPGPEELSYQFSPAVGGRKSLPLSGATTPEEAVAPQASQTRLDVEVDHAEQIRKDNLAKRLQEVFGLPEKEEVVEEMACWLLRNSLLKGYMFLTPQRICFFAHLPGQDRKPIKSGPLWKKSKRTKLSSKFWFVLRNDVLSWYESANEPYFPKGNVSLQYASSCDMLDGAKFKLRTAERNYTFTADTEANAQEWVRVLRKVIVTMQHHGESVKLIIPLDAVVEIERSPTLEFAETVEIKVVDPEDSMSVDSYFFAGFSDNDYAFDVIQELLNARPRKALDAPQVPSTAELQQQAQQVADEQSTRPGSAASYASLSRVGGLLRPLISGDRSSGESRVPIAAPPQPSLPETGGSSGFTSDYESESSSFEPGHGGYPPKLVGRPPPRMLEQQSGSWGTPGWIRKPAARLFGTSPSSSDIQQRRRPPRPTKRRKQPSVTEVVEPTIPLSTDEELEVSEAESPQRSRHKRASSGGSSLIQRLTGGSTSDWSVDSETDEASRKFHSTFAMPDTEVLIDDFTGYLYRMVPVHGRFYVSQNYFCFISTRAVMKTRMVVPIKDLYGLKGQKAFRFGHHALVLIVRGYEEIFLEFSSKRVRDECYRLLDLRMEQVARIEVAESDGASSEFGPKRALTNESSKFIEEHMALGANEKVPSPMFGSSTSSTFLDFKPKPMKITCLTIGSRGDVQPYIALCKGLMAEGHECTIATHGEYQEWVEGHGIGFKSVGGDPAELMQLCVDNGLFTVAFLKEGLAKMRTWLDDLLVSSWKACQGTDLLIESPSAMAGIHIAEALQIPYYRAFTMTWTRTRAYPQAFAVPEHKRGGAYNYMTYVMFDQVFWHAISRQVNRWRRKWLHLESTNLTTMEQDKVPFLYNFSPTIVPPPLDWSEWIHVCGYWFLDDASSKNKVWEPPAGIEDFIDGAHAQGKKVVYIGFGSIVVSDPKEMTRCVVDAIVESGVYAILSKGWSDRGSRNSGDKSKVGDANGADGIKYPDCIYAIDSIDHSWLFPRIDAAVHHGGAGTTGASLRAGLPTIIKPFFGDQFFWAERVESLGVGDGIKKLTTDALAKAMKAATTNERQIAKARAIGAAIRSEDGVGKAIQALYRDLDYAKSIIKPLPHHHEFHIGSRPRAGSHSDTTEESWSVVSEQSALHSPGRPEAADNRPSAAGVVGASGGKMASSGTGTPRGEPVETLHERHPERQRSGPLESLQKSLAHLSPRRTPGSTSASSDTSSHPSSHHHRLSGFVDHLFHHHDKDRVEK